MACQDERFVGVPRCTAGPSFLGAIVQPIPTAFGPPSIIAGSIYLSARCAVHPENIANSALYAKSSKFIYPESSSSLFLRSDT
jgi:hypothetical protein